MKTSHERTIGSDEWYTPPHIVEALGDFDFDPCPGRHPDAPVFAPLSREAVLADLDGLTSHWHGRVWLNPPYGRETGAWLKRLALHGDGVALVFARTDTQAFFDHVWGKASAIFFMRGRVQFLYPTDDGLKRGRNAGAPSVLIAYDGDGWRNANALKNSGLPGYFVDLTPTEVVWSGWACAVRTILQFGPLRYPDLYRHVEACVHRPGNSHIRAKIRQTLNRHPELFRKREDEAWELVDWEGDEVQA